MNQKNQEPTEVSKEQEGYLLLERLKLRSPEAIESFNINEDGLAVHGSDLSNLEGILTKGLGWYRLPDGIEKYNVDFNLIGVPAVDNSGHNTKIGFGQDRVIFGGQIIFVTDIFKKLWPNLINGVVNLTSGRVTNGVGGEILVRHGDGDLHEDLGRIEFYGIDHADWGKLENFPEPEQLLIPEFKGEKSYVGKDGKKTYEAGEFLPDDKEKDKRAYRQLLSCKTINAIVIPDDMRENRRGDAPPTKEAALEHIINVQNKLLPKNEQIPVYNEQGKCLYNPLENIFPVERLEKKKLEDLVERVESFPVETGLPYLSDPRENQFIQATRLKEALASGILSEEDFVRELKINRSQTLAESIADAETAIKKYDLGQWRLKSYRTMQQVNEHYIPIEDNTVFNIIAEDKDQLMDVIIEWLKNHGGKISSSEDGGELMIEDPELLKSKHKKVRAQFSLDYPSLIHAVNIHEVRKDERDGKTKYILTIGFSHTDAVEMPEDKIPVAPDILSVIKMAEAFKGKGVQIKLGLAQNSIRKDGKVVTYFVE